MATGSQKLVTNTAVLVALATSQSQYRALKVITTANQNKGKYHKN